MFRRGSEIFRENFKNEKWRPMLSETDQLRGNYGIIVRAHILRKVEGVNRKDQLRGK